MAVKVLWTLMLILHAFHSAEGIQCLYGVNVPVPTDSDQVITCGSHQSCYMDAIATFGGHVRYNLGCRDKLYCQKTTDRDIRNDVIGKRSSEVLVCTECCTGTLCNSVGCGHSGYQKPRGPICMSCDDQLTADDCNKITECGRDEVCMLSTMVVSTTHGNRYQTKCEIARVCHNEVQTYLSVVNSFAAVAVGRKRSLLTEKDVACSISCCSDDLCNGDCKALSSLTTTVPTTTTSATQSATYHCSSNPCVKGACSEYYDTYLCTCESGYQGRNCEIPLDTTSTTTTTTTARQTVLVDPCLFNPCANGICTANGTSYTCNCSPGYTGEHCNQVAITSTSATTIFSATTQDMTAVTTNIDYCISEPCVHGACTSVNGYAGFVCMCADGYQGQLCDTRINDPCIPNPCAHGKCSSDETTFWCECLNGYTGYNCDIAASTVPSSFTRGSTTDETQKLTDCSTNPCVHGNCFPVKPSSFWCICQPGFTGNLCDQIDKVTRNETRSETHTAEATTSTVNTSSINNNTTAHSCNATDDNLQYHVLKMSGHRSFRININAFGPFQQQTALGRCTKHCATLLHVDSLEKLHTVEQFLRQHAGNAHQIFWVDGQWHNNNWISSIFHRTRSVQKRLFNWMAVLNHHYGHCVALTFDGNSAKLEPHFCNNVLRPICEHN